MYAQGWHLPWQVSITMRYNHLPWAPPEIFPGRDQQKCLPQIWCKLQIYEKEEKNAKLTPKTSRIVAILVCRKLISAIGGNCFWNVMSKSMLINSQNIYIFVENRYISISTSIFQAGLGPDCPPEGYQEIQLRAWDLPKSPYQSDATTTKSHVL